MSETRNENTTSAVNRRVGRTGISSEDIKLIVKKSDFRLRTGLVCLRKEISGGCMSETRNENTTSAVNRRVGRTGISSEDIKLIVKKSAFRLWTGLVCLRTEISGGLL